MATNPFVAGSANAAAGSTTLSVPVTAATGQGDLLVVVGQDSTTGAGLTGVTDSTNGNKYAQQLVNNANGFNVSAWSAVGITQVGAAYSTGSYGDLTSGQDKKAAQELDTWMNGGGANWPTQKLAPRTMGFNVLRQYFNTDTLIKSGNDGWPTSAGADTKNIAGTAANGVGNICITFRPQRDGSNHYTGSFSGGTGSYAAELTALQNSLTYVMSIFPNAKFTLWHEANIFGVNGPFGNGSGDNKLGSPYTLSGTSAQQTTQMHNNWQAYVNFYGPAFHAAGAQLAWIPSWASPNEGIDFFDIALNSTQQGWFTVIGSDNYTNNFVSNGNPKNTLTGKYGTNNLSILDMAKKYSCPYAIWELGAGTGNSPSDNTFFLNTLITAPLVSWLNQGNPISEVLWFNYGGDVIGSAMDSSVLAAVQNMYDALQGTTTALSTSSTVTLTFGASGGVKQGAVIDIPSGTQATADKTAVTTGTSTSPSATTGSLSVTPEIAIGICIDAHASGAISWTGGWNSLVNGNVNGSSPFMNIAYQNESATSAVTASGTIVSGAWNMMVLTFPSNISLVSGPLSLALSPPKLAFTGNIGTSVTGSFSLALSPLHISLGGIGQPGLVYLIGDQTVSTGTSMSISVLSSVDSDDSVQVGVFAESTSVPTVGPDTAGNTYTLVASDVTETNAQLYIFECDGANPLIQGVDSIPVTQTVSGPMGAIAVGADGVVGVDKFVIAHGSSAAPSSGATATLSQPEEQAIAWIVDTSAGGTPTWASPWSSNVLANIQDGASTTRMSVAYQSVTATTALTASGTITSAPWTCAVTTLLVTPNAVGITPSNGVANIPYSQTMESSGGEGAKTWSITSGSLPPGLTLTGRVISGVPTTAGSYSFTITVTDSLSQTASLPVTVIIAANVPSGAPAANLTSNNLLSAEDSDFEIPPGVADFSWSAYTNANPPFATNSNVSSAISFTGVGALGWTSQADGPTAVTPAQSPVLPNAPFIFSGAIFACSVNQIQLGVAWYDSSDNPISTSFGPVINVPASAWAPMRCAVTSPPNAAFGQPIVTVTNSNAGDLNIIDMLVFSASGAQVLIDWNNSPFELAGAAGSSFMDVSPLLRLDGNGITYTVGRQDAINETQPASGSFALQNDNGQFAQDSMVSYPALFGGSMTLQRRARISIADELGVWHSRFDGSVSEIGYDFDYTGNTSVTTISLTDILAHLNRQDPFASWTKEQVLADQPLYHWSLNDAGTIGGAGVAAETSGNNGPPMRLLSSDSTNTAAIAFQDTSGGIETLADAASATGADGSSFWVTGSNQPTSPLRGLVSGNVGPFTTPTGSIMLTPAGLTSGSWPASSETAQNTFIATNGFELVAELSQPLAPTALGSDYSIEAWFMPDVSIGSNLSTNYGPFVVFGLGSSSTYTNLAAGLWLNAGTLNVECANYSQPPAFRGLNWPSLHLVPTPTASVSGAFTPDKVKRPHHLLVTIQGDPVAATVTLWVDGVQVGSSFTLPTGQTYNNLAVGGAYGGSGIFFGNISLVSIYPYILSSQQVTEHCQLGQYGMWEQTTDDCIAQLAEYANVPGFWSNLNAQHEGLTMAEYLDITNTNAISSMQQFEAAEHGLLWVDNRGALNFHTRSWRMGYGAPDLLLPSGSFSPDLQYKVIDQFMNNEMGIAGPNTLGANSTSLLANPATGQTSSQISANTVIQAGYINSDSQNEYGVYAQSPVTAPLSLPIISWSRGAAALGLAQFSFWPDPNLSDRAAWESNSRALPWAFPAAVIVDLGTLDPASGLGISNFYALGIDNMIAPAPGTLPPSFPDAQTSVEWFIEGITENYALGVHTITFYTSPAEPQRAWIPGDPVYGVLGDTTRIGISTADTSTPQAYGKSVSHDAGAPYWAPSFTNGMNANFAPDTSTNNSTLNAPAYGFVGAADIRGIAGNLQNMLQPPMCVVGAEIETQTFTNGALTGSSPPGVATMYWDTIFVDTVGGMGAVPGWPNWYLVTIPGYYEIDASIAWASTASQGGYTGQAWIVVGQAAAQAIAAGTGNPLTVDQYVCPVGEAVRFNSSSVIPVCAPTARMYLGMGDMVAIAAEQNFTSSRGTSTAGAGSMFSIRFAGIGTVDDRTLINSSIGSGGTVTLVSHGPLQQATFSNTHTYAYQGTKGFSANARRNADASVFQGLSNAADEGSNASQIAWNVAAIQSALSGKTVLSATLTGSNISSFHTTGAKAMLGTTKDTPGGTKWDADDSHSTPNIFHQSFTTGQTGFTFSIPITMVKALVSGGATAFTMGDSDTTDQNYAGTWAGGPGSWILTVNYA